MRSLGATVRLAAVLATQFALATAAVAQGTPGEQQAQPPAPPPTSTPPAAEPAQPAEPAAEAAPARERGRRGEEEIVVTGSRVRRKDLTTPAPVAVISRDDIQTSGKVTIGDFLQTLPEQGNAINTQQNNGGSGSTRIDLRGLGNQRTLVLINGRRLVNTGTGTGASGTGVDLNTVPTAAVERIEILKDGASAVYGSDAISGVINIITRKSFDGVEANFFSGVSTHGDGAIYDVNATGGTSGDKGSLLFSAGYYDQEPVFAGDRGFSQFQQVLDYTDNTDSRVTNIGSSRAPNGRVTGPGTGGNALWQSLASRNNCTSPGPDGKARNCSFTYDPSVADSWRPFRATTLPPAGDLYNFQPVNYDITPSKRISLYTAGHVKISEFVNGFVDGSYVNRNSSLQLAPEPLIIGAGGASVTISPDSIYNPFGRSFSTYSKRLIEFGPRTYNANVDTYRAVVGLNGAVSNWVWEASLNYGNTQWAEVDRGHLTTTHLQNAIGPSFRDANGVPHCGTPTNVIAGCVPVDLFHGLGAITPDMASYLTFPLIARISNELVSAQANFGGELPIHLLSERPLGIAFGYEYRFEGGTDIPDPVSAANESTGNNRQETGGHYYANEGYGELSVPIVSGMTAVDNLEATAAVRVFNYNTFGTDATYKFGGRWSIIRDVTLRGTYSTAFRAPSITDLFQGASDNFPSVRDPCADLRAAPPNVVANCLAAGVPPGGTGVVGETQIRTRNAGNPILQPETAKIWTAGVVLEPRYVRGLSVTLDYYHIAIDKAIQTLGASFILDSCYAQGNPTNCAKVHRSPVDSSVDRIDDFNENVGKVVTAGIDLGIRYNLSTEVGRFVWGLDGTWLSFFDVTQPDGSVVHGRGNFDIGTLNGGVGGVYPAFKALGSVVWNYSGFGAGVVERFIGSFKECAAADFTSAGGACFIAPQYSREISAYYQTDLFASYDLRSSFGRTTFGVGVRNVFNSAPPRIYSAFTPTSDATTYDFMGRFFYGRLTQRF